MKYQEVITWSTDGFFRETKEKVELTEEEKKSILKLAIHKTMDYIEENSFPANEEDFAKYVEVIFVYLQEKLS